MHGRQKYVVLTSIIFIITTYLDVFAIESNNSNYLRTKTPHSSSFWGKKKVQHKSNALCARRMQSAPNIASALIATEIVQCLRSETGCNPSKEAAVADRRRLAISQETRYFMLLIVEEVIPLPFHFQRLLGCNSIMMAIIKYT